MNDCKWSTSLHGLYHFVESFFFALHFQTVKLMWLKADLDEPEKKRSEGTINTDQNHTSTTSICPKRKVLFIVFILQSLPLSVTVYIMLNMFMILRFITLIPTLNLADEIALV